MRARACVRVTHATRLARLVLTAISVLALSSVTHSVTWMTTAVTSRFRFQRYSDRLPTNWIEIFISIESPFRENENPRRESEMSGRSLRLARFR